MMRPPFVFSLLAAAGFAVAQNGPVRFVANDAAVVRIAVHDAPGFVAALEKGKIGALLTDPEFSDALASGVQRFHAATQRWCDALRALDALDPNVNQWPLLVQRELWSLDWRDVKGGEILGSQVDGANAGRFQTTLLLEPLPAAEGKLGKQFEELADVVWKKLGAAGNAADAKIDGHAARIAPAANGNEHDPQLEAAGVWFLHLPGQFAAGTGEPAIAGQCRPAPIDPPEVALHVDVGSYLGFMASVMGQAPFAKPMQALGIRDVCRLTWRVAPRGALLQDDVALELGKLEGLFAALVHATAPLVDQPLPEGVLMQLRCAFDVRELVAVVDELLADEGASTLTQLGIADDLNKAWTGGLALAVCAPAGSLVPRVFVSFGIVDREALDRLLAQLVQDSGLEKKDVALEEQPCAQLKIPGAPPALSPTWCVQNGTLHVAESGVAMRAMLKAIAAKAPRAFDVGDCPRPEGKGAIVPGFDLRFDGGAMYAAYRDTWLPALELAMGARMEGEAPLVERKEMPSARTMQEHLGRGRGVLRQQDDRLVLSMNGAAGGPLLLAALATFGPTWSTSLMWSWHNNTDSVLEQLTRMQMERTFAAITAFTKRTGKRPESLADLIGAEITDAAMLRVFGDDLAEPVLRDGKEIARTSFRYYRDGLEATPQNDTVKTKLQLLAIRPGRWTRLAADLDGAIVDGYGEFARQKIDELERKR